MTLSPQDIAALDQVEAQWAEWFSGLSSIEIRQILDGAEYAIMNAKSVTPEKKGTIHNIFRIGISRLQVVAQTAREMK